MQKNFPQLAIISLVVSLGLCTPMLAQNPASQPVSTMEELEQIPQLPPQKSEGFTIVPADPNAINPRKFIFELKPGDKAEDHVYIKNLSDQTVHFLLYGADSTLSNQKTLAYKTRQNGGEGEGKWVTFEQPELDLGPQETKLVTFKVEVPQDTPMGDYKFGVTMEKSKKDINNPSITIATRVILHGEVKVTENPMPVPKMSESTGEKPVLPITNGWQNYYFWISLSLFVISFTLLVWATLNEKKSKRKAAQQSDKPETTNVAVKPHKTHKPQPTKARKTHSPRKKNTKKHKE